MQDSTNPRASVKRPVDRYIDYFLSLNDSAHATFFIESSGQVTAYPLPRQSGVLRPGPVGGDLQWLIPLLHEDRMMHGLQRAWLGEMVCLPEGWYSPAGDELNLPLSRWLRITCRPAFLDSNQPGTITDICVRVLDQTAERLSIEDIRTGDQRRHATLVSEGLCHELNNYLSVILAQASGLRLSLPPETLPPPNVGAIIDAAQQAAGLLRSAIRPNSERSRNIDLNALLDDGARVLAHLYEHPIDLSLAADLPQLVGHEELLRGLVLGLGRQMLPLLSGSTRLRIFSQKTAPAWEGLSPSAAMFVGTTALEISSAITANAAESPEIAFARAVVRRHRAQIELVSSEKGVYWQLTFPGVEDHPDTRQRSAVGSSMAAPPAAVGRGKILLADDEENFRLFISWVLKEKGFEIVSAKDGVEAFERFQEDPAGFTLVILDAYMPRMGGLESYLRMQVQRNDLPVIFASGFARGASMDALVNGCPGPASVLLKPFSSDDLINAVMGALAVK